MPRTVILLHGSAGAYGADRQLLVIATGLDPGRYRPVVVLPERGDLGLRLEEAGIEVQTMPVAVLKRSLLRGRSVVQRATLLRRSARDLAELAFDRKARILHTNSSIVLGGQEAARACGIPHLLHLREVYEGAGGRAGRLLWPMLRTRLARADAIACVSERAAAQLGATGRTFVLHDAVPRTPHLRPRAEARARLGLAPDAFVIATVGRISDWKGQDILVRALAEPGLASIGAVGVFAGDASADQTHFVDSLEALAAELGLGERVRLLGFMDDLGDVLGAADVFTLPSRHPEAFPNALLEAALAGLPIVATDNGGQREIVRDGVTGRLVPPDDHPALASALRAAFDGAPGAAAMGEAAARDIRARFGTKRLIDALQERYDLLHDGARRTAWLLPIKRLAVPQPVATDVRLDHLQRWLRSAGYEPIVHAPRGLRSAPALVLRGLRERPALVLTSTAVSAPAVKALKRLLGRRLTAVADVMGLHSLEVDQALSSDRLRPLVRRAWVVLERMLFESVDLVLTVNERHASVVRRRYRPARVHALPFAAETELCETVPADREELGLDRDSVVVGFVGSLIYSRLEPLFAAWPALAGDGRLRLVVVGDGPDLARYRARAEAEGWLGGSVTFLGGLPRPRALSVLRACDIAYTECWSEAGFPYKLFEYMALGLPIVTEGKSQIAEVLQDRRDALFFRGPNELADRIRELADDPELRARLGEQAQATLLAGHTVDHRDAQLSALLDGGLPGPAPPARGRPSLVSVVLPVRNEEAHIANQLEGLTRQTYEGPWELLVVDNGCSDRTIAIAERWRDRVPALTVVDARGRRSLNHARNVGAEHARGDFLVFCDGDDVVAPEWLEALVEAGRESDIVCGSEETESLNAPAERSWRPPDSGIDLPMAGGFLPYVSGGNCGMWTDVARTLGWDESFVVGSSDIEFSWRAHLAGYRAVFAPGAVIARRHPRGLRGLVRQYFVYGKSDPQLYRAFRRVGMPRDGVRVTARRWRRLVRRSPDVLGSIERRGDWVRLAARSAGRVAGSIRWRTLYL